MTEDLLIHCLCDLTPGLRRKLNGFNSLMLARITGSSVCEEVRSDTAIFDVVKTIRVRRRVD